LEEIKRKKEDEARAKKEAEQAKKPEVKPSFLSNIQTFEVEDI
jgi:hypothetical protein